MFATRSPFRPNPVGLSVVELREIEFLDNETCLHISNADLMDGTPLLDIKPYIPYTDSLPQARAGFAQAPPPIKPVNFSAAAIEQGARLQQKHQAPIQQLITEVLQLDPRPAYKAAQADDKIYGLRLYDFDVKWRAAKDGIQVLKIIEEAS